jgi:hypothetical protein
LLLFILLEERLLDLTVNADKPFFRMSGTVPKVVCLCLKFAGSFFGCSQLGRKAMGDIHGSLAVCFRQIGRLLHQGNDVTPGIIRHHSGIRDPLTFPGPWTFDEIPQGYRVLDADNRVLAYVLASTRIQEDRSEEPTQDEAWRIARLISSLPDLRIESPTRIWLFSGRADSIVPQRVMDDLAAYYAGYVDRSAINYKNDIDAQHAQPTDFYGNPCRRPLGDR